MSIVNDVLSITDDILGIRDDLGAIKEPVYLMTRVWEEVKGIGNYLDSEVPVLPTPFVVDYSHKVALREGGSIRQGDIILKHISKQSYPTEDLVDCSVNDDLTEKWYKIGDRLYEVISVTQDYVYWNVQVRKTVMILE